MDTTFTTGVERALTRTEMVTRRAEWLGVSEDEAARDLFGDGEAYEAWLEEREQNAQPVSVLPPEPESEPEPPTRDVTKPRCPSQSTPRALPR